MGDVFLGVGAIVWLLLIIVGLFFVVLSILMPWFVYKIRLEVREINNHLDDLKTIISKLSRQLTIEQNEPHEISPEETFEQSREDSPIAEPYIQQNPLAHEVPNNKEDDDLRYAPPEFKK